MNEIESEGKLFASGPFLEEGVLVVDGLTILQTNTIEEARAIMQAEPLIECGLRTFDLRPWGLSGGRKTIQLKASRNNFDIDRSELEKPIAVGQIEDAIYFVPDEYSRLTYAIEHRPDSTCTTIRYERQEVAALIPTNELMDWRESDQVGIYTTIYRDNYGNLEVRAQ